MQALFCFAIDTRDTSGADPGFWKRVGHGRPEMADGSERDTGNPGVEGGHGRQFFNLFGRGGGGVDKTIPQGQT